MAKAAKSPQASPSGQRVVAPAATHLAIAATDGNEVNAGSIEDWLAAMRIRQALQKDMTEWVKTTGELAGACRDWLALNSSWVREIAVRLNAEPASVSLYVVVKDSASITLEQRRSVADMGLVVGGGFGVRAEARIVGSRPVSLSFILA